MRRPPFSGAPLGALLGALLRRLGNFLGRIGTILGCLGALLGSLGAPLGAFSRDAHPIIASSSSSVNGTCMGSTWIGGW